MEVEAKSKVVRVDEEAATIKADAAQGLKNECESDLAEAIPALEAALSALNTLKVGTHSESRQVLGMASQRLLYLISTFPAIRVCNLVSVKVHFFVVSAL